MEIEKERNMKKKLKRIALVPYYYCEDQRIDGLHPYLRGACSGLRGDCTRLRGDCTGLIGDCTNLVGDCTGLYGDCSGLRGDCSGLRGDCTHIFGDCTGLSGSLNACRLTKLDRRRGVDLLALVEREKKNG